MLGSSFVCLQHSCENPILYFHSCDYADVVDCRRREPAGSEDHNDAEDSDGGGG